MGGSQSTTQKVKYCLYQKEDFNTMISILQDVKDVSDRIAENIYNNNVPIVIKPFSKLTRNYFESLKSDSTKTIMLNGNNYTLCSIAEDIYIYNKLEEKRYKTDEADKKDHLNNIFLKSQKIIKLLLEILYQSCDGSVLPGFLNKQAYKNLSLKDYYRFNPLPSEPTQSELTPSEPTPSEPTPSESTPSE